ncbi:Fcf2 pre-rRNA processing-domain-containing protein [Mycena floridula]|nr:Fcf2 pre-rRNA processing-domain-containing protein [Mycena floridula]
MSLKGKEKATEEEYSSSDSESESEDESATQEYLNSLFEKARQSAILAKSKSKSKELPVEDDIISLESKPPIPSLDPGNIPKPYFTLGSSRTDPSTLRDPAVELAEKASAALSVPAPPLPPPELSKSGKPLTKKEKKALKNKTTGPDWFDLPAPSEADLPRLYREVEALRLRNQLDPKRFYRKDEGEGKGIAGLPKHFAIGTIVTTDTPFGGASSDNLTRASRKRTLVDELVDDAEAKRYAKKKFEELQAVRGARGRNTLVARREARRGKW